VARQLGKRSHSRPVLTAATLMAAIGIVAFDGLAGLCQIVGAADNLIWASITTGECASVAGLA
jgi:hypothetical protein